MMKAFSVGAVMVVTACTNTPTTTAVLAIPGAASADAQFYDTPYPNDLRRHPDGTIDVSEFPSNSPLLDDYRNAMDGVIDGFGKNEPVYLRVDGDGEIDPGQLPSPEESMVAGASVYLVDVGTGPNHGMRTPAIIHYHPTGTKTIDDNYLVVRPYPGFPLDDGETYAAVLTRRIVDAYGGKVQAAEGWSQISGKGNVDGAIADARAAYKPLLDWLDANGSDDDGRSDVASAAVFTTQHTQFVIPAIKKGIAATAAPVATGVTLTMPDDKPGYSLFTGMYMAPNFQTGIPPYAGKTGGGEIKIDANGAAIVQVTENLRFAMTVPKGKTMPLAGWPVVIYSHGTGGDYESFVDDGTGAALASEGMVTISMDQVLHGPRNPGGGSPDLNFFNFQNPLAARDNALQGAADAFSQRRLIASLAVPGDASVKFDDSAVYFFGHSQGGVTGPGFVAYEDDLKGAVLSGTAGLLSLALLAKTEPYDIPSILNTILDDAGKDGMVDVETPSIGIVQLWMERADPINFAPIMVRTPASGLAPRNIYQTEGFVDHYAPNPGIEAFATALGSDIAVEKDRADVEGVALRGRMQSMPLPIAKNAAGGAATCVLAQFKQAAGSDGHFVVFDIAEARYEAAHFLGTLAASGTATVSSLP